MTISSSHERTLIAASATVTILAGCAYVFACWAPRGQAIDGALRCITLACVMIAVHAWGWKLYRLQGKSKLTESMHQFLRHADLNWQMFKKVTPYSVIGLQIFTWLLASLILDGGDLFKLLSSALLIYWVMIFFGCFVRTNLLTRVDMLLIRFGFWILPFLMGFALHAVWSLKGVGH